VKGDPDVKGIDTRNYQSDLGPIWKPVKGDPDVKGIDTIKRSGTFSGRDPVKGGPDLKGIDTWAVEGCFP